MIAKEKEQFVVKSHTGKVLGRFDTEEQAVHREKQIRYIRNKLISQP